MDKLCSKEQLCNKTSNWHQTDVRSILTYAGVCCGQTSQRVCEGCREENADAGGGKPHSQKCSYSTQPANIQELIKRKILR